MSFPSWTIKSIEVILHFQKHNNGISQYTEIKKINFLFSLPSDDLIKIKSKLSAFSNGQIKCCRHREMSLMPWSTDFQRLRIRRQKDHESLQAGSGFQSHYPQPEECPTHLMSTDAPSISSSLTTATATAKWPRSSSRCWNCPGHEQLTGNLSFLSSQSTWHPYALPPQNTAQ